MYVSVLGNENPTALPVVELDLSKLPEGTPKIAGTEVKWRTGSEAYRRTKTFIPTDLDDKLVKQLQQTAVSAYQALELRDYGRIDVRVDKGGKVFVLEVNPNPWLHSKAEVALAAKESGRSYPALIEEIVNLALARYGT
jgi:D-alanine-D-alanine ligase